MASVKKILIVGQGLAGTLAGYRFERAGCLVHYRDAPDQRAASEVAAGIVNPITGRRFVKSWRTDELLPEVHTLYSELETLLGVKLWYDLPVVRSLHSPADENFWSMRTAEPGYADYLADRAELGRIPELTTPVHGYGEVLRSGRVDIAALVAAFRGRLEAEGRFARVACDYREVGGEYDRVIFCEGWRARFNPFFSYLPHRGSKGDVLIATTEAPQLERILKHKVFLVPYPDGTYWVGASSQRDFETDDPDPYWGDNLREKLSQTLTVGHRVIDHRAAVRPTVVDRRPLIGPHPENERLWIFNGLGTKGASIAPLASRWLVAAALAGEPLPPEVDIARFPFG